MMEHEISRGLPSNWPDHSLPNGSRTLLRLHRALAFITRLFGDMAATPSPAGKEESFSTVTARAYDETLAGYHTWIVRKGVHLALYALPSRHNMLHRMRHDGTEEQIVEKLHDAVAAMSPVYDKVQALYIEFSLQNLP